MAERFPAEQGRVEGHGDRVAAVTPEITRVAEDYLTLIWKAGEWPDDGRRPATSVLAAALGVTLSTVSANLKKLARERMIDYEPYGAITLTAEGERIALEVVRRHRIIETFLVEHLGLPWDEIHEEADRMEHAASDKLIARMDDLLGHPAVDPHGDPIPRQGTIEPVTAVVLSTVTSGDSVQVMRVSDENPEILRFLRDRGIGLGSTLRVSQALSGTGLMAIRHGEDEIQLSAPIATAIHVVRTAA